jgi:hypothetical protein
MYIPIMLRKSYFTKLLKINAAYEFRELEICTDETLFPESNFDEDEISIAELTH